MSDMQKEMNSGEFMPILQEILTRVIVMENLLHSQKSKEKENEHFPDEKLPPINWTASKTDLIELIYGLHASKAFNNGKTTLKAITQYFESTLGLTLGNTSLRFQEILRRKDSVAFLDQIRASLESYISRIDEK
jgi:hypothetical protein